MPKSVHAIYEKGVFRPTEPVDLPEHTAVEVQLASDPEPKEFSTIRSLSHLVGSIKTLPMDPLDFQKRIREEWD